MSGQRRHRWRRAGQRPSVEKNTVSRASCSFVLRAAVPAVAFAVMLLPLAVTAQTYSLVVGVDGLGPYGIDAAATPYIDSLADGSWGGPGYRGAITLQAYAGAHHPRHGR